MAREAHKLPVAAGMTADGACLKLKDAVVYEVPNTVGKGNVFDTWCYFHPAKFFVGQFECDRKIMIRVDHLVICRGAALLGGQDVNIAEPGILLEVSHQAAESLPHRLTLFRYADFGDQMRLDG